MSEVIRKEDLRTIGHWFLVLSIPMVALMAIQYQSSQTSIWNVGAGGASSDGQHFYTRDHVRASGTFSYDTGISAFFPFVQVFLIASILRKRSYPVLLLLLAACACILAIPLAGNRTLIFRTALILVVAVVSSLSSLRAAGAALKLGLCAMVIAIASWQIPIIQDAAGSLSERWTTAENVEAEGDGVQGVLQHRVIDLLLEPFKDFGQTPFLGEGIGLGSNIASQLTTGGRGFLLSESEWIRMLQECGPFFGLIFISYRVFLCISLLHASRRCPSSYRILCLLLAGVAIPQLLLYAIEQSTNLGFMAFGAGLCLAATRRERAQQYPQILSADAASEVALDFAKEQHI